MSVDFHPFLLFRVLLLIELPCFYTHFYLIFVQVSVPMFFAPAEVSALQYPPLVQQVAMRGKFLHQLRQKHFQAVDNSSASSRAPECFYNRQVLAFAYLQVLGIHAFVRARACACV